MTVARAALFLLALCLVVDTGRGETYRFSNEPVPAGKSLQAVYRFYVYAGRDSPLESQAQPYVEFNTVIEVPPGSQNLKGIQLSLIPYLDFWALINPQIFCSIDDKLMLQPGPTSDGRTPEVYSITVPVRAAEDQDTLVGGVGVAPTLASKDTVRFNITRTDVYALVISNCGSIEDAKIWGRVTTRNVFGYLPGDWYYKMQFYGLLSVFYICLAALWFIMVCSWLGKGKELHHLHHCISCVMFLSVVESFFSWLFMREWNSSSHRPEVWYVIMVAVSVIKPAFSYAVMLITGLGWGVTRSELEFLSMCKVHVLVFLYCSIRLLWEFLAFYQHPYAISNRVLALPHVAGLLVNTLLFLWILAALRSTAECLQGESRSLFRRIRGMIILGLCLSLLPTAVQLLDLAGALAEDLLPDRTAFKWHYQWFVFDGSTQIIFGAVFIGVLCQWAPHNDTRKHLYAEQVSQVEDDEAAGNRKEDATEDAAPGTFAIGGRSEDEADDLEVSAAGRGSHRGAPPAPALVGAAAA